MYLHGRYVQFLPKYIWKVETHLEPYGLFMQEIGAVARNFSESCIIEESKIYMCLSDFIAKVHMVWSFKYLFLDSCHGCEYLVRIVLLNSGYSNL